MPVDDWRRQVDDLDRRVVNLLNERARLVLRIWQEKDAKGQSACDLLRERDILRKVTEASDGPLSKEGLEAIYREIISACRSLEKQLCISYFGPEGTFSHFAATRRFGSSVRYSGARDIEGVFRDVEAERADYGVVPIENSTEGAVSETLDMLSKSSAVICGELYLRVHHSLLALDAGEEVKRIYSKPEAFAQCRKWLSQHYPDAELIASSSTASACKLVKEEGPGSGAIAHSFAGEIYSLAVIARNIEDEPNNVTRFIILGRDMISEQSRRDKTSIMVSVEHRPGALCDSLMPFKKRLINLTWIEPRPSKENPWEYYFFFDFEGHCTEERIREALEELREGVKFLKVLGSFPIGESI